MLVRLGRARPAILLLALSACGSAPSAPSTPGAGPDALAALSWLEGTWQSDDDPWTFETWSAPTHGVMYGFGATVGARVESHEHLRLEADGDAIRYVASPAGQATTAFALVDSGPRRAVFANPRHDFPKRIEYARTDDVLLARVFGDDPEPAFEVRFELAADRPQPLTPTEGRACVEDGALAFTIPPCWCGDQVFCDVQLLGETADVAPVVLPGSCDACVEITFRCALPAGARRVTVFGAPLLDSTEPGSCASGPGLMIPGAAR